MNPWSVRSAQDLSKSEIPSVVSLSAQYLKSESDTINSEDFDVKFAVNFTLSFQIACDLTNTMRRMQSKLKLTDHKKIQAPMKAHYEDGELNSETRETTWKVH